MILWIPVSPARDCHRVDVGRTGLLVDAMTERIKAVQRLVGTEPDGIMGPKTRAAMAGRTEGEILHPWARGAALPHSGDRREREIRYIVVHHSDTRDLAGMVRAMSGSRQVSTHYSIDLDGTIREHLDPWERVAWHCVGANLHGIGVDVIHRRGMPFPDMQVAATGRLLRWLCLAHGLPQVAAEGRFPSGSGQLARQAWGVAGHGAIQATRCPDGFPIAEALRG